ncbi:MAG: hypothetical protein F6K14_10740 [Symploca sp. SIO2C1]|nr:hypothetical protein [Symploca sp. SIO2C1]
MVQSRPIIDQVKDTQQPYSHVSFSDLPVDKLPFRVEWRGTIYSPEDTSIPLDLAHALNYLNAAQKQQYQNELAPSNSQFQAIADNTGLTSGHGVLCRLSDETTWTFEPYTFEAIASSAGLKKAAGALYRNPDGTWVFQAKSAPTFDEVAIATSLTPEEGSPYRQIDGSWIFKKSKKILNESLTIYVKPTIGNDDTADGTETLPFKTITGSLNWLDENIDNGRFNVTVSLEPGTYDGKLNIPPDWKLLRIEGDRADPFSYKIVSSQIDDYIIRADENSEIRLIGVSIEPGSANKLGLLVQKSSIISFEDSAIKGNFSQVTVNCVDPGSQFVVAGKTFVTGNHGTFFNAVYGGRITLNSNFQFQGNVNVTNFLSSSRHSHILVNSIASFAGNITGKAHYTTRLGIIEGITRLPASLTAGSTSADSSVT